MNWKTQICKNDNSAKFIYRLNIIPTEVPEPYVNREDDPRISMEMSVGGAKKPAQSLKNKIKAGRIKPPDIKTYHTTEIKTDI